MKFTLLICAFLSSISAAQQICNNNINHEYHHLRAQGDTVADSAQGLIWSRCSVGQTWQDHHCIGNASRLNKQETDEVIEEIKAGWRLPSIKELQSLVNRNCSSPALNIELFPQQEKGLYWSSTAVEGNDRLWVSNIDFGGMTEMKASKKLNVRLVRSDPFAIKPIDQHQWDFNAWRSDIREFEGENVVSLKGKTTLKPILATLAGVELQDADVSFKMNAWSPSMAGNNYAGLAFRVPEDQQSYDVVYLRYTQPEKYKGAVYIPVENKNVKFDKYRGPNYTANFDMHHRQKEWIDVRVTFQGKSMAIYIDGNSEPSFQTDALESGNNHGNIAFFIYPTSGEVLFKDLVIKEL